jgi:mRNA interferase HicA
MKRNKIIKYILANGCALKREGGDHTLFINLINGNRSAVPRHTEISDLLCNDICKQLGIPKIK